MDNYKIVLQKNGRWQVLTRQYFWQRWKPYPHPASTTIDFATIDEALRFVGSAWWKEFRVRVDSIGVW